MSNNINPSKSIPIERWINHPEIQKGILAVYANEPFGYDTTTRGYELGRQIAILAKKYGLSTRGSILRKKPNSTQMAIVRTKLSIVTRIIHELGFVGKQLSI